MPVLPATVVVLVIGGFCLWKRADIRLVLIGSAVALFALRATQPGVTGARLNAFAQVFVEFAKGMTRASSVVPICSAMGFAYVCKLTACDAHLVHMLVNPLRRARWAMIPGGIAVAFFVNSAIVSQTSTVSVVGPVIIPLLLAAGYSRVIAGSLLLLGGSMGGELMNPAAVEVAAIKTFSGADALDIIAHIRPYNLLASGTALLVFWGMTLVIERRRSASASTGEVWGVGGEESLDVAAPEPGSIAATMSKSMAERIDRVNIFKAMVPLVPIFLLLVVRKALMKYDLMPPALTPSKENEIAEQATIAAAMLIGVVCAGIMAPRQSGKTVAAFFEGAGFAYAHVISIITAAAMFAEAVKVNGLIEMMTSHLRHAPVAVTTASVVIPWVLACVTGTAVGTAPLVIGIILPIATGVSAATTQSAATLLTAMRIGGVNAIASQFGRTSSPVAPVTIMCATLARTRPLDLVKLVLPPLLAGGIVLLVAALLKIF